MTPGVSARPAAVLAQLRGQLLERCSAEPALLAYLFFSPAECEALARELGAQRQRRPTRDAVITACAILRGEAPIDPMSGAGEPPPFEADDPDDSEVARIVDDFYDSLAEGVPSLDVSEVRFWFRPERAPSRRFLAAAQAHPAAAGLEELSLAVAELRSREAREGHADDEAQRRAVALARPARLFGFPDEPGPRELLARLVASGASVPEEHVAQFNYQFAYALLEDRSWLEARPWPGRVDASAIPPGVRQLVDGLGLVVADRGRGVFENLLGAAVTEAEFQTLATAAIVARLWNRAPERLPDHVLLDAATVSLDDWREAVLARSRAAPAFARAATARGLGDATLQATLEALVKSADEAQAREAAAQARGRADPLEVVREAAFDPAMIAALKALWSAEPSEEAARALEALLDDGRAERHFLDLGMALATHGDQQSLDRLRSFVARAAISPALARLVTARLEARLAPPAAPSQMKPGAAKKTAKRRPTKARRR
jgi:hypothetical protein